MNSPLRKMATLAHLIRWDEWYDSKLPLFAVSICTALLLAATIPRCALMAFAQLYIFSALFLAFGYMVNDYSDIAVDRAAGKHKIISTLHPALSIAILVVLALAGVAVLLPSNGSLSIVLGVLGSYFLALAYSCRPSRLKERGIAGLIVASVAQRVMPIIVIGLVLHQSVSVVASWALLGFFIGLRYILIHQHTDLANDLQSGVQTFATARAAAVEVGIKVTILCELLALAAAMYPLVNHHRWLLIVIGAYGLFLTWYYRLYAHFVRQPLFTTFAHVPLADWYFLLLPGILFAMLAFRNPVWLVLLGIHLLGQLRTVHQYYSLPYRHLAGKLRSLVCSERNTT